MTYTREILKDAAIGVAVAETPEGLSAIHQPGCAAAIWLRQPTAGFQQWIDALDPGDLPQARMTLQPALVRAAITELCNAAGTPERPERTQLIDDIAALAHPALRHRVLLSYKAEAEGVTIEDVIDRLLSSVTSTVAG